MKKVTLQAKTKILFYGEQIKCVHTHPKSGQNVTLTTAKMQVHEEHYGFETKLKKAINVLANEAYLFAVEMKSSQMKVA